MTNQEIPNDRKSAESLTMLSIACHYGVPILYAINKFFMVGPHNAINSEGFLLDTLSSRIVGTANSISWILILVARSKDKTHAMSKTMLWVYILEIIASIVFSIVWMGKLTADCVDGLSP